MPGVTAPILEKALAGERIDDAEALTLLESRDLLAVGRVANELRARRVDPSADHVHRRPQRQLHQRLRHRLRLLRVLPAPRRPREGYLLPKPVIYKKIEETLELGGTGLLMQGGHHPDLGDRLLRGSLPLDQGALPDPPARAVAAGDPAHLAALEADRPRHADPPARRRARLDPRRRRRDPRRPRPRHHRAEEDEDRGLAERDAPRAPARACRRRRR